MVQSISATIVEKSNRRISQTVSGTTTNHYYSASWQVLEERVSGTTRSRYVWSPVYIDALILRDRDADSNGTLEERLWSVQDANYNVTALVDGSGNVVERYGYDAFGQVTVLDASYNTRSNSSYAWVCLWQGLRRDATTTLYHARYREVSATLGRPLQRDPIGFAAGDAYVYRWVGNGPTNAVDPFGEYKQRPGQPRPTALPGGTWVSVGEDFYGTVFWHWVPDYNPPKELFYLPNDKVRGKDGVEYMRENTLGGHHYFDHNGRRPGPSSGLPQSEQPGVFPGVPGAEALLFEFGATIFPWGKFTKTAAVGIWETGLGLWNSGKWLVNCIRKN